MRTAAKTLIRLGGCPGWYESSLDAQSLLVLSCRGSYKDNMTDAEEVEEKITVMILNILTKYCKFPKYSDTQKICCNLSKIWTMWLYHRLISPNDADGMANSVDPDQTSPLGAVWSGSALFAQAYLSENWIITVGLVCQCGRRSDFWRSSLISV